MSRHHRRRAGGLAVQSRALEANNYPRTTCDRPKPHSHRVPPAIAPRLQTEHTKCTGVAGAGADAPRPPTSAKCHCHLGASRGRASAPCLCACGIVFMVFMMILMAPFRGCCYYVARSLAGYRTDTHAVWRACVCVCGAQKEYNNSDQARERMCLRLIISQRRRGRRRRRL